jgi:hypothetical protein
MQQRPMYPLLTADLVERQFLYVCQPVCITTFSALGLSTPGRLVQSIGKTKKGTGWYSNETLTLVMGWFDSQPANQPANKPTLKQTNGGNDERNSCHRLE